MNGAVEAAVSAAEQFEAAQSLEELQICLLNPAVASRRLLKSHYFTPACQALLDEKLIVVNEGFLREVDTAIRTFAQADKALDSPFIRTDAQMFGLVRRIESEPARSLERLRRYGQRASVDPELERQLRVELAMVVLFFLGHELGHFMHRHPSGQFATFVDPKAPLEDRIQDSVVRLCRHVDEFYTYKFGLQGFADTADPRSEVRRTADELRKRDEKRFERHEAYFANETQADDWANRIVIAYLEARGKENPIEGERELYLFAGGVFAAALYTWYQDLDRFAYKLGGERIGDIWELSFGMMPSHERYIHAASLFGERHRFTLLRAALALETVLRARTRWFDDPVEDRTIWCPPEVAAEPDRPEHRSRFWLSESLQRYSLLCACMDTAVKLANVGCATGWMVERGTPKLFVMHFYGITHSLKRVRELR